MASKSLVIIGAGPGGYTAAFRAADLGMQVTLIDSSARLGGVCLNKGCIPSKALLHLAKLIHETNEAGKWGLNFGKPEIDLDGIRNWKNSILAKMTKGLALLQKQRGIRFIQGQARFQSSHSIKVENETLDFDAGLIAVGSRPVIPDIFKWLDGFTLESTLALELDEIPKRLLVVGGGYIGLEMGTVYAALGSRVTVVEMMQGLLPGVDRDLVRPLHSRLRKEFENIFLGTEVTQLIRGEKDVKASFGGEGAPKEQDFDRILLAVGREPNSDSLGLEKTGVELDEKGFIRVDSQYETKDPGIFAIGDVIGGAQLAHKASHEAKIAIQAVAGRVQPAAKPSPIPAVIFTHPEIAWCGMTETEAERAGFPVEIAKLPLGVSARLQTMGGGDGLVKLMIDPESKRILGGGLVGPGVGELIGEVALAIQKKATVHDLAEVIHPHPTLSEALGEAADHFLGQAVHVYKKR